jgi:hypothetical protein
LITKFDDEMMWYHVDDDVDGEKKIDREAKITKKRPSAEPYKIPKMEPGTGGEKPRSGKLTRSVYNAIGEKHLCDIV